MEWVAMDLASFVSTSEQMRARCNLNIRPIDRDHSAGITQRAMAMEMIFPCSLLLDDQSNDSKKEGAIAALFPMEHNDSR